MWEKAHSRQKTEFVENHDILTLSGELFVLQMVAARIISPCLERTEGHPRANDRVAWSQSDKVEPS